MWATPASGSETHHHPSTPFSPSIISTTMGSIQLEQEGRLQLAIRAIQNGKFNSIREAARAYDLPHSTLTRRVQGIAPKRGTPAATRKLTQQEEDILVQPPPGEQWEA